MNSRPLLKRFRTKIIPRKRLFNENNVFRFKCLSLNFTFDKQEKQIRESAICCFYWSEKAISKLMESRM